MGDPVVPFEAGNNCNACTPELFIEGRTPKHIYIVFRNIEKCHPDNPDPPNGCLFVLNQHAEAPCVWSCHTYKGPIDWDVYYCVFRFRYPDEYGSTINLRSSTGGIGTVFDWWLSEICKPGNNVPVDNQIKCILGEHYELGTATVFWQPDDIPLELTETYGFHPGEGNLHDRLYLPDDKQCIKIANKFDKTNVLFSVDETQF